ncbi:MAG: T9SS type A sorting domain-containing protein [Flavobacteriales bacterium]
MTLTGGGGGTRYKVNAGTLTLTGTYTPDQASRYMRLDGSANGTFSGALVDAGFSPQLRKYGSGTWTLSGNNTYTGDTELNSGKLELGASERISSSSTLQANGGTFSTDATTGYLLSYVFVDHEQNDGTSYYQLKQFDYDGKYETFNVVAIDNNSGEFNMNALFPNPTSASMTVNFQSEEAAAHFLFINDAQGNEVYSAKVAALKGENQFQLATQNFSDGIYFVRIVSPRGETVSRQVIVQR